MEKKVFPGRKEIQKADIEADLKLIESGVVLDDIYVKYGVSAPTYSRRVAEHGLKAEYAAATRAGASERGKKQAQLAHRADSGEGKGPPNEKPGPKSLLAAVEADVEDQKVYKETKRRKKSVAADSLLKKEEKQTTKKTFMKSALPVILVAGGVLLLVLVLTKYSKSKRGASSPPLDTAPTPIPNPQLDLEKKWAGLV